MYLFYFNLFFFIFYIAKENVCFKFFWQCNFNMLQRLFYYNIQKNNYLFLNIFIK